MKIDPEIIHFLNEIHGRYQKKFMQLDPVEFIHRYENPVDQEIAGFIAAALAIGRVDAIRRALDIIFSIMGPSPAMYVKQFDPETNPADFNGFVYRFYKGNDIALLIHWMHQIYQQHDTLEAFFLAGYDPAHENIGLALSHFVQSILKLNTPPITAVVPPAGSGIRHFLADPARNSACKRLNLFLRWMIRRDTQDTGLWKGIRTNQLVIPLDTHITRLSRCLGLTRRKSPDWRMAEEITRTLKFIDPEDPVKFDFALCTFGKLNACPVRPSDQACQSCRLHSFCRLKETAF